MRVIICPGIHSVDLTNQFLAGLGQRLPQVLVFPAAQLPPYSPLHLLKFIQAANSKTEPSQPPPPLLFIAFSAGVVGAIGAARLWQRSGGRVKAVLAIDGWGVPLYGDFPIHRISHDSFTHWTSARLGAGQDSFYADPAVGHLDLWRSPQTADGWWVRQSGNSFSGNSFRRDRTATTAAEFIGMLFSRYSCSHEDQAYESN
ncbi:MAG: hypothetical protein HY785_09770 [Oscillatoriophycideae cyanobacterium NC_groundwater_1537_Pr4_S-0.65um_50_18]|nr:hypothetical protein [Oscillatoriophycideae cyanobacterium NC_groundwater_1537_Pr4_S-0.65um_50_18]